MGIKGLFHLVEKEAPNSYRTIDIKVYSGKKITCDASNVMYSFLAMTGSASYSAEGGFDLTDKEGNPTGHLLGLFNRTIAFLENKIKPVWVFDGKPPELKMGELMKRKEAKDEAKEAMAEAKDAGDHEQMM